MILYEGSQNKYSTILPVGCLKICVRIKSKTGSVVTGTCQFVNVNLPDFVASDSEVMNAVWLKIKAKHLSQLVKSNEDLATITSYAGSLGLC